MPSARTLGFGDIVPTIPWLRVAVPVQALISFRSADGGGDVGAPGVSDSHPAVGAVIADRHPAGRRPARGERVGRRTGRGPAPRGRRPRTDADARRPDPVHRDLLLRRAEPRCEPRVAPFTTPATWLPPAQAAPSHELRVAGVVLARSLDSLAARLDGFLGTGEHTDAVLEAYTDEVAGAQRSHL